jgi:starch synthase
MALGKPVIAFGVGGVAEMLEEGVTGTVVPFAAHETGTGASVEAVQRLADAFVAYATDEPRRILQGAAARARVLRSFDARAHARAVQGEILAACGEPR